MMKDFTNKVKNNGKDLYIVGDMNLNLLDHRSNSKVKEYLNIVFQNLLIPMINKPTRVSKSNATIIDHILTKSYFYTKLIGHISTPYATPIKHIVFFAYL